MKRLLSFEILTVADKRRFPQWLQQEEELLPEELLQEELLQEELLLEGLLQEDQQQEGLQQEKQEDKFL